MAKVKVCAITRSAWAKAATASLAKEIGSKVSTELLPEFGLRDFDSGSFGGYTNGKVTVNVNGTAVTLQCSVIATVVNSKEAKA